MELTIVGSASAAPNAGSASSCYLLDAGRGKLLLECGHGAASKLLLYTSLDEIGAILISHMHPDHFFDLVPLKYHIHSTGHPRLALNVPPEAPAVLEGIAKAMGADMDFWESVYDIRVFDPAVGVQLVGIDVSMTPTHHYIPAWAMRFTPNQSAAKTMGFTSDTSFTETICAFMSGAFLLLAESSVEEQSASQSHQGHLTPAEAARLANAAGVRQLVLTHYPVSRAEAILSAALQAFSGPCTLAVEGAKYVI